MTTLYNTEQQTIESVNKLLTAHGYDPAEYDLEKIAADYLHEPGLYNSVFENPSYVWANIKEQQRTKTKTRQDAIHDVTDLLTITSALVPHREPSAYNLAAIVDDFHSNYGHYNIGAVSIGSHDMFGIIDQHRIEG